MRRWSLLREVTLTLLRLLPIIWPLTHRDRRRGIVCVGLDELGGIVLVGVVDGDGTGVLVHTRR